MWKAMRADWIGMTAVVLVVSSCAAGPPEAALPKETEPGVRVRLYWIGQPIPDARPMMPGQSANVDVTIDRPRFTGDEAWFTNAEGDVYRQHYVLQIDAWVRIDQAGVYGWQWQTASHVQLSINQQQVDDVIELSAGWHRLCLMQYVNDADARGVHLRWRPPGLTDWQEIPNQLLRARAFYFRPTQPGRKHVVGEGGRPGLGQKVAGVHPGYRVTTIRPRGMAMPVGGLGMLPDGRLVVARFDATTLRAPHPTPEPNGELWLLSNHTSDDRDNIHAEKIADGLFEPSGVCIVGQVIYVSQRDDVSRFTYDAATDTWQHKVVAGGWRTNDFHQISAGLLHEPGPTPEHPGFLYMARSPGLGLWRNPPDHGSVWRIDLAEPVGENVTPLTGGHRTPNGIGFNAAGEIFVIDNQGEWKPANELNHVQEGHFYGFYQRHDPPDAYASPFQPDDPQTGNRTAAAVLLPQDEIANSPTQPLLFPQGHLFEGQLAMGDMRYGGINRVYLEKVDGIWQGCVMRFTQGLESGPNRILFGPDGSLYVGMIGGQHASTWAWDDAKGNPTYHGLQRMTPTGDTAFEIYAMSATPDGFLVTFTQPVPATFLNNPANFNMSQWTYKPTRAYGGPKIDLQPLVPTQARATDDRRGVHLTVPGLKEGYVIHLQTDPVSDTGEAIWSGDVWYTLNRKPLESENGD